MLLNGVFNTFLTVQMSMAPILTNMASSSKSNLGNILGNLEVDDMPD
jgi:hypothetical protein